MRAKTTKAKSGDRLTVNGGLYIDGHAVTMKIAEEMTVSQAVAMLTPAEARKVADNLRHAAWQLEREIRKTKERK